MASEALNAVTRRWGLSRDAAVRELLVRFIAQQRDAGEDKRLTHISTAMKHPQCLEITPDKPTRYRLKFRAQPFLIQEATSLAYRVPGHSRKQAHLDYASRPLTDAILTALAIEESFTEEGLENLPDVLQWREANGLWRLTVAATLTRTERTARREGASDLVEMLEDAEVVWHSPWRSQMMLLISRRLLTGQDATENRRWIGEQRDMFRTELESVSDPRVVHGGHEYTEGAPRERSSAEGRAATAIWRARRQIALPELAKSLCKGSTNGTTDTVVDPPGWKLPLHWWSGKPVPVRELAPRHRVWVEQDAVLHLTAGSKAVLWPLTRAGQPLPGIQHVISGAKHLHFDPIEIAEAVLVNHYAQDEDETDTDEDAGPQRWGRFPVMHIEIALEAGLVDPAERDAAVQEAHDRTEGEIQRVLKYATTYCDPEDLDRLRSTRHDPRLFTEIADDLHQEIRIFEPLWTWQVHSVPEILDQRCTPSQRQIRGREWCRHVRLALERDMHMAWNAAMWHVPVTREDADDAEVWYSPSNERPYRR